MRIQGPYGTNSATQANGPRRASGSGFSLPDTESVTQTRPASAARLGAQLDRAFAASALAEPPDAGGGLLGLRIQRHGRRGRQYRYRQQRLAGSRRPCEFGQALH